MTTLKKPHVEKKTAKELEQEEALQQINAMLDTNRPKNFREGVGSGVGTIMQGAIGAVGIAVLAPTIGLAAGAKQGGLLGAVVGVTGGAVVGLLGAGAMAVGGTSIEEMLITKYVIVLLC